MKKIWVQVSGRGFSISGPIEASDSATEQEIDALATQYALRWLSIRWIPDGSRISDGVPWRYVVTEEDTIDRLLNELDASRRSVGCD